MPAGWPGFAVVKRGHAAVRGAVSRLPKPAASGRPGASITAGRGARA
jgi:hypothetical protein